MAATMMLGEAGRDGLAPIFVRVQDFKTKTQVKQKTGLMISPRIWDRRGDEKYLDKFRNNAEVARVLAAAEEIRRAINAKFDDGVILDRVSVHEIVYQIVNRDQIEKEKIEEAERKLREREAKKMTLGKYMDLFVKQIKSGERLTEKGTLFASATVLAVSQACERLKDFEEFKGVKYDFEDIDMNFYREYMAYLNSKMYSINTVGKYINQLKTILSAAESEGYHQNKVYHDKKFKGRRIEVDSIYLPKRDLDAIRNVDLAKFSPGHDLARDIFMIGVWTAQRVSDYNKIRKEDIQTVKRRSIEDVPVSEGSKETVPTIVERELTVVNVIQKKTGARLTIPCSSELKSILEKYEYDIPRLSDVKINKYMKEVAQAAGLTEPVRITSTKGGKPFVEVKQKYELVHSHTARRTGATLMYLSGMDVYDIIKITGHSSPTMLKKYIKADQLEVAEKITDKYDYFD